MYFSYLIGFICGAVASMIMAVIVFSHNPKLVDTDAHCECSVMKKQLLEK